MKEIITHIWEMSAMDLFGTLYKLGLALALGLVLLSGLLYVAGWGLEKYQELSRNG